ncbi:MAG: O-antigen ligase family protein, partial [Clostridia bacterium]|nr:O-antigen ligase family protein [Clostridia bacterium]
FAAHKAPIVKHMAFLAILFFIVVMRYRANDDLKFDMKGFKDIYVAVIIMLGYGLMSFVWGSNATKALDGIIPWIAGWAVAMLQLNAVNDEKEFNAVITDLHIYFVILLFIGWKEMTSGEYTLDVRGEYFFSENDFFNYYPVAGYYNTNNYAYVITSIFPFMLYDYTLGGLKKFKLRYPLLVVETVFFFWLVLNTTSRLAFISLVTTVIFIMFYNTQNLRKSKLPIIIFVAFLAIVMVIMLTAGSAGGNITGGMSIGDFFIEQFNSTVHPETDSDENRLKLLVSGVKTFLDHPFGVGIGKSASYTDEYMEGIPNGLPIHNMIVIILAELGVIGGAAYLYTFFRTIYNVWKTRLKNTDVNLKAGFILASILNFFLMSMCPSNATNFPITFFIFGVWLSFYRVFMDENTELELISKNNTYKMVTDADGNIIRENLKEENIVGYYNEVQAKKEREQYLKNREKLRERTRKAQSKAGLQDSVKPVFVKPEDDDD